MNSGWKLGLMEQVDQKRFGEWRAFNGRFGRHELL